MLVPAHRVRHCGLILALLGLVDELSTPTTSRAAGYTFNIISDSNSPDLTSLNQRKINDSGEVSFKVEPAFASYRIYKGDGTNQTQAASSSFWALDWPGNGAIDNTGYVTFRGGITNDTVGIYRGNGGSPSAIAIGDQDRSTAGTKTYYLEISVSGSGNNIVWHQRNEVCTGDFNCGSSTDGYFALIGGNGTSIAQQGATWSSIPSESPVINDVGQVAFVANSASDGKDHLVRFNGPNSTTIDSDYTGELGYWMNNAGDVIFSEVQSVRLFHNGSTTTVASTADGFSHLQGRAFINDSGDVAFYANVTQYNGNPVSWAGVYTGPDIANDRVLVHGDTVLGHAINSVELLGLNNAGQMVMSVYAQSPDPWRGLIVATPQTGNYDGDNDVDAADYVFWRKTGINGQAGYLTWRSTFGQGAGNSLDAAPAVPEASDFAIMLGAAAVMALRRPTKPIASQRCLLLAS
jgi:hypothetical protein